MVQVVINPPREKIADDNGHVTTPWYKFFVSIQKLLGGDSGGSDPFDDAILVATSAAVAAVEKNEDDVLSFHRTPGILTASAGLTGGGDMEGNVSVSVGAGTGIAVNADNVAISDTTVVAGSYGSASEVGTFTVNAQGQLTAAANVTITAASVGAVPTTRVLTAGAGLTGGGDLSADRAFDVGAGTGIVVNANDVALDTASTRNTDHASVTLTAGNGLTGGGTISASRTFDVGAGTGITVGVDAVGLDTTSTRNTDHTAVTLTAGAGLTGGGDISASRSFAVGAGTGITVNADDVAIANTAVTPGSYGSATSVPSFTVDQQGRLTAASGNTIPTLTSGTHTPTLTNEANLAASTAYSCQYFRVGDTVTMSGRVDVDPTAATTNTQLGISLPIASNFANSNECAGTAFASGVAGQGAAIYADAANNRARMQWLSGDVTNQPMFFTFTYRVLA